MKPSFWPSAAWFAMPRRTRRIMLEQRRGLDAGPFSFVRDWFAIRSTWADAIRPRERVWVVP